MTEPKAKKIRLFQQIWQEKYGCIETGDRVVCCLCGDTITGRTYNIERHIFSKHEAVSDMPKDEKLEHIKKHVLNFNTQKGVLQKFVTQHHYSTTASYAAALAIARNGKPFSDEIPLSARTVQRRIKHMAEDIDIQIKTDLLSSNVISISLDESNDINNMARLAIIARFASINCTKVQEELCVLTSMDGTTKGSDILIKVEEFTQFGNEKFLDLKKKLFSITTDGAPSMRGKNIGFVKLLENQLGRPLLSFHCIIHEENLCAKASMKELNNVMKTVVKIVNIITARSALTHRRFKSFLQEIEAEYGSLLLHSEVRWLSRGKVLNRFIDCFDAIQIFLVEIGENYPELNDKKWFLKLLFLTDIMNHYNEFNKRLQGNGHTILKLFEEWKSFCSKIVLFETDVKTRKFNYFLHLKSQEEKGTIDDSDVKTFESYINSMKDEFENRFQTLKTHGPMFTFITKPDVVDETILELQYFEFLEITNFSLELIDLKSFTLWTDKFETLRRDLEKTEDNHLDIISTCWASLPTKFTCLKKVAFALLSAFGSSYNCEQTFSQMKYILNKNRSSLTTEHSDECVRLKVSTYEPNLSKLTATAQHHGSH
ncbi:general transcription factor II-I repeat domain-containing protein 2B-like [Condylostylus longicornis]|uniref:general transcription factor II-I repeat domain-containing protein 2B-like n=1 Tax=Condylostylus longicornis TaxID=2530218 RepID=UPI00244E382F|nr:general transcription factor II-I repeat domain-containing protein 2B-like [Condylostylus longicornis]